MTNFIHPDDQEKVTKYLAAFEKHTGMPDALILQMVHKKGHSLWYELSLDFNQSKQLEGLLYNVSALMQDKLKLQKNEEWFKRLYSNSPLAYHSLDAEGNIISVNPIWCSLLGYKEEEIIGQWIGNFMAPESIPVLQENFPAFKKRGHVDGVLFTMIRKNGSPVEIQLYGLIAYDDHGHFKQTYCTFRDVTAELAAQQALENSEKKYHELFDAAGDGILITDKEGQYIDVNKKALKMLGYTRKELLSLNMKDLVPKEELKKQAAMRKEMQMGHTISSERTLLCKAGSLLPVLITGKKLPDGRMMAIVHEKTENILNQYFHIVSSSSDMMAYLSTDYHYLAANDAYRSAFGLRQDEIIGKTVTAVFGEAFFKQVILPYTERCLSGELVEFKEWFDFPKTGHCYMNIHYYPHYGRDHEILGFVVNGRNITANKQAEDKLNESEQKYRSLFEQSADALLIIEGNTFVDCNEATVEMLGYKTRTEFLGVHPSKLSPSLQADGRNSVEKADEMMATAYKNGSHRFEWLHKKKNGDVFPVEVLLTSVPNGEEQFLHVVWRDITERKLAEASLRKTTADLISSQKVAGIGSYVVDIASGFWTSSGMLDEVFDIPTGFIKDISGWLSIVHPDDMDIMQRYLLEDVLGKKQPFDKEFRIVKMQSGITRWVHGMGELTIDEAGNLLKMIGTIQDITEKKEQQLRIKASENYLSSVLNNEPECVKILDMKGKLLYINPAGLNMIEADSLEQVTGKKLIHLALPAYKKPFADMLIKVTLKGEAEMLTFEMEGLKGRHRWLETHSVPYKDVHGKIIGLLGVTRDITEKYNADQMLKRSLADKEVLLKELFHRTKNNMQVMVGLLTLQMQQIENKQAISLLQDAKDRIYSMAMVHDRLLKSKNLSEINFKEYLEIMVSTVASGYAHMAKKVHLAFDLEDVLVNIDAAAPCALVVNEIISNAMKYAFPESRPGNIKVSLKPLEPKGMLLKVSDDGIGFPDNVDWRNTKSMGMWIIKNLAENQLHGKVSMKTSAGKGTSFTIKIANLPDVKRVNL